MGVMVVWSNAADGRDDEFNRWYDEIHVPEVLGIGPMKSCQRFRLSDSQMEGEQSPDHRYLALYEFEGDSAAALEALTKASETFNMSETLASPQLIIVEPLGPPVNA